ncbi:MAG: S8 family serine peptidase [Planctomycetota bacterium]|jgi:hypothetical protein|nr:S8 family serine peptidase [Planctomycetota bacterium]
MKFPSLLVLSVATAPVLAQVDSQDEARTHRIDATTSIHLLKDSGQPAYRISVDAGRTWCEIKHTDPMVHLVYAVFDPKSGEPSMPAWLRAPASSDLHLVQFATQNLAAYDRVLGGLGAKVGSYVPGQCVMARIPPDKIARIRALPFVRWVGRMHTAYKIDASIHTAMFYKAKLPRQRYVIRVHDADKATLLPAIGKLGGQVWNPMEGTSLMTADLAHEQVLAVAHRPEVVRLEPAGEAEQDMDIVRWFGGADWLEPNKAIKYTGKGVRGHIMEGAYPNHREFPANSWRQRPIGVRSTTGATHGNATMGVVFAAGTTPQARGLCPDGQASFTNYNYVMNKNGTRKTLVAELQNTYRMMMQTASWGYSRTTQYSVWSVEMDELIFERDMPITQSQSNAGATSNTRNSRPQAWAKNIISVGGMRHYNNKNPADDAWAKSGSTGPASDGRLKPDLCAYYDSVYTTYSSTGYGSFGGTSAATPIVNGHLGLALEMWTDGDFGYPMQAGGWTKRYENRPHYTTAKGLLINTAYQYGLSQGTRVQQGWGFPNVQNLYNIRNTALIVNEQDVLQNLQSATYFVLVKSGTPAFRATMNYADPAGTANSSIHRVNSLDLRVTGPAGTQYWGNNGLASSWNSSSGGSANDRDTVENVFVPNPRPGLWTVQVTASALRQDGHTETTARDADFALVVSGISGNRDRTGPTLDLSTPGAGVLKMTPGNVPSGFTEGWTLLSVTTTRPVGQGAELGLGWDGLTTACFFSPKITGWPFHFPNKSGTYPHVAGAFTFAKGLTVDGMMLYVTSTGLANSNVSRVKL